MEPGRTALLLIDIQNGACSPEKVREELQYAYFWDRMAGTVIPKMSSSVFVSTNIAYVLRNLGIEYLIVMGILTDQCVESAVRDACDEGFLLTLIDDACATKTQERHDATLRAIKGYCRQRKTEQVLAELGGWKKQAAE